MFCRDAIHFVAPPPAFAVPSNSKFFFLCQVQKVKAVSILSKEPHSKNTTEKFWLFFFALCNLVHSVSSALVLV